MTPFDEITTILDRITATGVHTEADRAALLSALRVDGRGNVVVQIGKYNVHIERGQDIQIGDRITYEGPNAEAIRQTIRQMLDEYRLRPGIPFQAPPLPEHFVPRPEVTDALKTRLLTDKRTTPGILVVSAIYGLGGIGKSTLAAALAYDLEVQRRFNDGILWATLGQQPDLLSLLSGWIQALGDYNFHPTTVESASMHLRTLLHDKVTLLVVDDVWQPEHALPFRVGGPQGQVLITTRRADVANEVGADLHQMDVMTSEQALDLLSSRLRRPLDELEQEEALQLTRVVGYLPLALELAAARVARGTSWTALLQALEEEIVRLEVLEGPRPQNKLEASFHLSLDALRMYDEKAWQAFIWLGILPEDVRIAAPMAATLWEMDQKEAADMLELLWNDALLLPAPSILVRDRALPAYRIHDLLHDIARHLLTKTAPNGLELELPKAHSTLLKRYKQLTQNGLWHTLPDDGYIHTHLTWHMEKAGQSEQIHVLLREETTKGRNGWYEACSHLGQTTAFLADVTRGWQVATENFANSQTTKAISLQCRYALTIASLNSQAKNLSTDLMIALVKNRVWSPLNALTHARQTPNVNQRVEMLTELVPFLPESLREQILLEALLAARTIQEGVRVKVLIKIASYLSEPIRNQIFIEILTILQANVSETFFIELIPHLAELGRPDDLLPTVRRISHEIWRVEALTKLASYLTEPLNEQVLTEAMEIAWQIKNESWRISALQILVPFMTPTSIQKVFAVVQEFKETGMRYTASRERFLVKLAPYLSEQQLKKTLEAVRKIRDESLKLNTLRHLAPWLPKHMVDKVVSNSRASVADSNRDNLTITLAGFAQYLPETTLREILKLLEEMPTFKEDIRQQALAIISSRLAEIGYSQEAFEIAKSLKGENLAQALRQLAPYLSETLLREALELTKSSSKFYQRKGGAYDPTYYITEELRGQTIVDLAPYLSQPLLHEALLIVNTLRDDSSVARGEWYTQSPKLGGAFNTKLSRERAGQENRANTLAGLAPHLSESLLLEALIIAESAENRIAIITGLTPYLSKTLLEKALIIVSEIRDDNEQELVLATLAPQLAKSGYPHQALNIVRAIRSVQIRVWALTRLIPHLSKSKQKPVLSEALLAMWEIENPSSQVEELTTIAPYLPERILRTVLVKAQKIMETRHQSAMLARLIPRLAELGHQQEAIELARSIERADWKAEALASIATYIESPLREVILSESIQEIHQFASMWSAAHAIALSGSVSDSDWIPDLEPSQILSKLSPLLPEPMVRDVLAQIQNGILSNYCSETILLPRLAELGYEHEALAITQKTSSVPSKIWYLANLGYVEQALITARSIDDEAEGINALIKLLAHLPELEREEVFREVLEETLALGDQKKRTAILSQLAAQSIDFYQASVSMLWQEITSDLIGYARKDLLTNLHSLIPIVAFLGGPQALEETFHAIRDVGRWWP